MMNAESGAHGPAVPTLHSFCSAVFHSAFCIQHSAFCILHFPMPSLAFPKSHHLRSPREFDAVYAAKTREARGPVTVYAKPNGLSHPRLGLSVSRKVGNAVKRNRIRRRLREAMRLMQHDFPAGYDLVIVVRPHEPQMLADYQRLLAGAVVKLHNVWRKRPATRDVPASTASPSPNRQSEIGNPQSGGRGK
jgi:ribonuclease P protein component